MDYLLFLFISLAATFLLGPAVFLVIKNALVYGVRKSLFGALGNVTAMALGSRAWGNHFNFRLSIYGCKVSRWHLPYIPWSKILVHALSNNRFRDKKSQKQQEFILRGVYGWYY